MAARILNERWASTAALVHLCEWREVNGRLQPPAEQQHPRALSHPPGPPPPLDPPTPPLTQPLWHTSLDPDLVVGSNLLKEKVILGSGPSHPASCLGGGVSQFLTRSP